MSQEPQGLVKYECFMCSKQFIVGMVDEEQAQLQNRAIRCPFCGFAADSLAFIEPDSENYDELNEMGCMGIYHEVKEGE